MLCEAVRCRAWGRARPNSRGKHALPTLARERACAPPVLAAESRVRTALWGWGPDHVGRFEGVQGQVGRLKSCRQPQAGRAAVGTRACQVGM